MVYLGLERRVNYTRQAICALGAHAVLPVEESISEPNWPIAGALEPTFALKISRVLSGARVGDSFSNSLTEAAHEILVVEQDAKYFVGYLSQRLLELSEEIVLEVCGFSVPCGREANHEMFKHGTCLCDELFVGLSSKMVPLLPRVAQGEPVKQRPLGRHVRNFEKISVYVQGCLEGQNVIAMGQLIGSHDSAINSIRQCQSLVGMGSCVSHFYLALRYAPQCQHDEGAAKFVGAEEWHNAGNEAIISGLLKGIPRHLRLLGSLGQ